MTGAETQRRRLTVTRPRTTRGDWNRAACAAANNRLEIRVQPGARDRPRRRRLVPPALVAAGASTGSRCCPACRCAASRSSARRDPCAGESRAAGRLRRGRGAGPSTRDRPAPRRGPARARRAAAWLGGSADSLYILSLAQRLFECGHEVVRLNLRDHGDTTTSTASCSTPAACPRWSVRSRACRPSSPAMRCCSRAIRRRQPCCVRPPRHRAPGWVDRRRRRGLAGARPGAHIDALESGLWIYRATSCASGRARCGIKQAAWPGAFDFGAAALARPAAHDCGTRCLRTPLPDLELSCRL